MDTYSFFYKDNKDRLYAYLLRMTGDRQLALDLVVVAEVPAAVAVDQTKP